MMRGLRRPATYGTTRDRVTSTVDSGTVVPRSARASRLRWATGASDTGVAPASREGRELMNQTPITTSAPAAQIVVRATGRPSTICRSVHTRAPVGFNTAAVLSMSGIVAFATTPAEDAVLMAESTALPIRCLSSGSGMNSLASPIQRREFRNPAGARRMVLATTKRATSTRLVCQRWVPRPTHSLPRTSLLIVGALLIVRRCGAGPGDVLLERSDVLQRHLVHVGQLGH